MVPRLENRSQQAPSTEDGDRLLAEAVRSLYRIYRDDSYGDGDSAEEALLNALNMARMSLDILADESGFRRDLSEGRPTDVEYVTPEEFDRRPEPLWFSTVKRLLDPGLTPDEAMTYVKALRRANRKHPLSLFAPHHLEEQLP